MALARIVRGDTVRIERVENQTRHRIDALPYRRELTQRAVLCPLNNGAEAVEAPPTGSDFSFNFSRAHRRVPDVHFGMILFEPEFVAYHLHRVFRHVTR